MADSAVVSLAYNESDWSVNTPDDIEENTKTLIAQAQEVLNLLQSYWALAKKISEDLNPNEHL